MRFFRWELHKDDLHEELQAHLRMAIEDRVARGESPEEARAAAMREMGNLPLVADVTRFQWGWLWLEQAVQDARYALRQLRKSPGYTVTVLLTLMLTLGANTAIFGLLYALLLRSLPVSHPERIVQFELRMPAEGGSDGTSAMVSDGIYDLLASSHRSLSGVCGWEEQDVTLRAAGETVSVPAAAITGGCMPMLGLHPAIGRLMQYGDDRPGGAPEGYPVVLSYNYWRTHWNADPAVIGRRMNFGAGFRADAAQGVIVGVMQEGFDDVQVGAAPEIFVPLEMVNPVGQHNFGSYNTIVLGRLQDGVELQPAQAEAETIFQARLKSDASMRYYTFDNGKMTKTKDVHLLVLPGRTGFSYLRSVYQRPLYIIEGMVGLSLLVASAYLAMLAATRALARRRELAVRIALGASRGRVATQLAWESVLLVGVGTLLGVVFAWAAQDLLKVLVQTMSTEPLELHAEPDGVVLLFTAGLMAVVVSFSGLWPAWRASKVDPVTDIKEGDSSILGRRAGGIGRWLIPAQIAFSLVIVTMAALMATTVARLMAIDPGFRTSGITILSTDFSSRVTYTNDHKQQRPPYALFDSLLDRIQKTPGVESASVSMARPFQGGRYMTSVTSQPLTGAARNQENIYQFLVTPGYFKTMSVPLLGGRDFNRNDESEAEPICILNRSAAEHFFPGENALGKLLTVNRKAGTRIVGIVGDTIDGDLREKALTIIYQPYLTGGMWNPFAFFAVRAHDTATAVHAVREALHELAPDVAVDKQVTIQGLVRQSMGSQNMVSMLAAFFALLTLALTGIGLYGVMSNGVVRRRTEIGVRMALGATPAGVLWMILHEAMRIVLPGLVLGAGGVWAATRLLKTLLYGVEPHDPWVCAVSLLVLAAVAVCASLLPAQKAARVHPSDALRSE